MKPDRGLIGRARLLRRSQTPAERKLWRHLAGRRTADAKFRRQHPIGPYIVDFVSLQHKLVIEVDGGHHNWARRSNLDEERTVRLEQRGYQVLRFWNNEVEESIEGVVEKVMEALSAGGQPSPRSSP